MKRAHDPLDDKLDVMRPDEVRAHLRRQPFQPIRIHISDGAHYDVRHPELALVTRTEVVIALASGDDDIPERSAYCDPVHITRIEPLNGKNRGPAKRKKR